MAQFVTLFVVIACLFASARADATEHSDYAFGADLSFLKQVEDRGTKF